MSFVEQKPEIDGEKIRELKDDAPIQIETAEKPEIDGDLVRSLPEGAPVGLVSHVDPTPKPKEEEDSDANKDLTVATV